MTSFLSKKRKKENNFKVTQEISIPFNKYIYYNHVFIPRPLKVKQTESSKKLNLEFLVKYSSTQMRTVAK